MKKHLIILAIHVFFIVTCGLASWLLKKEPVLTLLDGAALMFLGSSTSSIAALLKIQEEKA